jgi:hypothetical protein
MPKAVLLDKFGRKFPHEYIEAAAKAKISYKILSMENHLDHRLQEIQNWIQN